MGSAPAPGAIFRALAENIRHTRTSGRIRHASHAKELDARRVQPHPGRVCSPTPVFGLKQDGCTLPKQLGTNSRSY